MIHKYFYLCLGHPRLLQLRLLHLFQVIELAGQIFERVQITALLVKLKFHWLLGYFELGRGRLLVLIVCNSGYELGGRQIEGVDGVLGLMNNELVILVIVHRVFLIHFLHNV